MLKELFESVVSQAHKSLEPEQPKLIPEMSSKDGRRIAYVYKGEVRIQEINADPRKHRALTAAALVTIIEMCAKVAQPMLFITGERVTVTLDDDRRESTTLVLPPSDHLVALGALPQQLNQREAIAFLRKTLCGTGFEVYVEALRNVVFDRSQSSAGRLTRDQESMGKSIEAKVAGTQDMPEMLRGDVMIFDPTVFRAVESFRLGCDAKLMDEVFEFWLPPNALDLAINAGVNQLIEYLQEALPEAVIVRGEE